jgi:hypothetical protein
MKGELIRLNVDLVCTGMCFSIHGYEAAPIKLLVGI